MNPITLYAEKIGQIGPLPVTNTLVVSWIVVIFLLIFAYFSGRKAKMLPSSLQNLAELCLEPIIGLCDDLAHSKSAVFFPIVMTFFLYIVAANWFGLFPGFGTIGFYEIEKPLVQTQSNTLQNSQLATRNVLPKEAVSTEDTAKQEVGITGNQIAQEFKPERKIFVPFLRSINADLNMTLGLGLLSVLITHIFAIRFLGLWGYLQKWFSLNPIFLFVGLLELVGEITKTLSLSLRLFGNIFAGEVVLSTISNLLAFLVPLPFYFLEIIVGVVQATVFALLTLVFMVLLSEKHTGEVEH